MNFLVHALKSITSSHGKEQETNGLSCSPFYLFYRLLYNSILLTAILSSSAFFIFLTFSFSLFNLPCLFLSSCFFLAHPTCPAMNCSLFKTPNQPNRIANCSIQTVRDSMACGANQVTMVQPKTSCPQMNCLNYEAEPSNCSNWPAYKNFPMLIGKM